MRLKEIPSTAMGNVTKIDTWNIHAVLTGQMDMYEELTGYSVDEQEVYIWCCLVEWYNFINIPKMDNV